MDHPPPSVQLDNNEEPKEHEASKPFSTQLNSNGTSEESRLAQLQTPQGLESASPVEAARKSKHLDFPDGGLRAWLQVVGCFFFWFNSWYNP